MAGIASDLKMRDDGGGSLISHGTADGVAPIRIVGASASVIFRCTIKSRRFFSGTGSPGSPGKRAVNCLCVFQSVLIYAIVFLCCLLFLCYIPRQESGREERL